MEHLELRLKNLKISEIKGEDVEVAVAIVSTSYDALKGASRPEKSFIPDDLPLTVHKIFQTTSVDAFNKIFLDETIRIQITADKENSLPLWPRIKEITSLASRTYNSVAAACVSAR